METLAFTLPSLEGASPAPHRVACHQWGDPANDRVLVCVHGLTRNGRDFDFLAQKLGAHYRVLCPDMPGRGESDWLTPPAAYHAGQYVSDIQHMLNQLNIARVDWVGTSMGGIIGMIAAGLTPERIGKMVLNDVGSFIPKAAMERLQTYVGKKVRFASRAEADAAMREIFATWGIREKAHWDHLTAHSLREAPGGAVELAYDPSIAETFLGEAKDVDLSHVWNAVQCPVLILRGAESDLLLHETAEAMAASRPGVTRVDIPGCGHAPHLMSDEQIQLVAGWLEK